MFYFLKTQRNINKLEPKRIFNKSSHSFRTYEFPVPGRVTPLVLPLTDRTEFEKAQTIKIDM
jgi:hypothetical protein